MISIHCLNNHNYLLLLFINDSEFNKSWFIYPMCASKKSCNSSFTWLIMKYLVYERGQCDDEGNIHTRLDINEVDLCVREFCAQERWDWAEAAFLLYFCNDDLRTWYDLKHTTVKQLNVTMAIWRSLSHKSLQNVNTYFLVTCKHVATKLSITAFIIRHT